ncbi:hypothetical protein MMC29_002671 [Sticta canariensis]|nr:hypothetical protein [Sticta canariensis]
MNHSSATKMHDSDADRVWIAEMLKRKRKQTDREIADFKGEKEREYIAFEQRLRAGGREVGSQGVIRPSLDPRDVDKRREEPPDYGEKQGSNMAFEKGAFRPAERSDLPSATSPLDQHPRTTELSSRAPEKVSAAPFMSGSSTPVTFHEREVEFQGLFTPSYLPLLDSSTNNQKNASSKTPLTISIKPNQLTMLVRDPTSTLSSSATLPTSVISSSSSPPTARQFSVSLPREGSLNIRRSSSKSDTSIASLRSSLRDPTQPRSPKRVLFSIDNVVVSPSTSPLAQRSSSAPQSQATGLENVSHDSERAAIGESKEGYNVERWDDRGFSTNSQDAKAKVPSKKGKEHTGGLSYRALESITAAPLIGGDDFERVGYDDDLFSFDEDMDLGEPGHVEDKGGDVESDDEGPGDNQAMTSSSPHAGSLPIEIKWPARQDPRK